MRDIHAASALSGSAPRTRTSPAVRSRVPLEDLDGRRLPRAVRAEDGDDLALLDLQVESAHGLQRAVRLPQPPDRDDGLAHRKSRHVVATPHPSASFHP